MFTEKSKVSQTMGEVLDKFKALATEKNGKFFTFYLSDEEITILVTGDPVMKTMKSIPLKLAVNLPVAAKERKIKEEEKPVNQLIETVSDAKGV